LQNIVTVHDLFAAHFGYGGLAWTEWVGIASGQQLQALSLATGNAEDLHSVCILCAPLASFLLAR
jgi:hypothetical protein